MRSFQGYFWGQLGGSYYGNYSYYQLNTYITYLCNYSFHSIVPTSNLYQLNHRHSSPPDPLSMCHILHKCIHHPASWSRRPGRDECPPVTTGEHAAVSIPRGHQSILAQRHQPEDLEMLLAATDQSDVDYVSHLQQMHLTA